VLGALSPRTRNAQVELYQSGDVDFLVATDAIGMGLNLALDHVAFSATRKFDGRAHRDLTANELGQIAGRAGRHLNDGTFGVTGDVEPFSSETINRLESHEFEPVKILQWRNTQLDFSSLAALKDSLRTSPSAARLARARAADDVEALDALSADSAIQDFARAPAAIKTLWEVCQIPDYRKVSSGDHAEMLGTIYKHLMGDGETISEDWFAAQVAQADRTDGDIDTLSNRIAHIRTWTFVSNRAGWLADPEHWRERTRAIEDTLSDALHELLTQRFVDRRTSVLMKSMRDKDTLYADIENTGQIFVEKHYVGKLEGFRFTPDSTAAGLHGKAARHAAAKILAVELTDRAGRLCDGKNEAFKLERNGAVTWEGHEIGRLEAGEDHLRPSFALMADEHLALPDKERIAKRVEGWLSGLIETRLKPLVELSKAQEVTGLAKGIAFRLVENFGVLRREAVSEEIRSLDQEARAELRKFGVRFGAYNIYFPLLLKPAAADLLLLLWALRHGAEAGLDPANLPEPPRQGLTSVVVDKDVPEAFYTAAGFQVCGARAIRIDMLERLADMIRPLTSWRPTVDRPEPPAGAIGRGGFKVQPDMLSIIGCSGEEMGNVLFALGFRKERRVVQPQQAKPAGQDAAAEVKPADGADDEAKEADAAPIEQSTDGEPQTAESSGIVADAGDQTAAEAGDEPVVAQDGTAPVAASAGDAPVVTGEEQPEQPSGPDQAAQTQAAETAEAPATEAASEESPATAGGEETAETAVDAAPAAEDAARTEAEASQETAPAEPEYEEIWRPRRRGQNDERRQGRGRQDQRRGQRTDQQQANPENGAARPERADAAPPSRGKRQERGDRPQGGDKNRRNDGRGKSDRRRNDKPRQDRGVATAAPPDRRKKEQVADKDSPFAALLELKEKMSRETQDQA
jgi:ATP-dependent RNA helicase SUPV3L1/SUV3